MFTLKIAQFVKVLGMFAIVAALVATATAFPASSYASATNTGRIVPGSSTVITKGKVEVTVINSLTGKPLEKAIVAIIRSDGETVAKGYTNSSGKFWATLPEQEYDVLIRATGFKTSAYSIKVAANEMTYLDSQLEATAVSDPAPSTISSGK